MASCVRKWQRLVVVFWFILSGQLSVLSGVIANDADVLVEFKKALSNNDVLYNWNNSTGFSPCSGGTSNWVGLRCNEDGTIDKIILEHMNLSGKIDVDVLAKVTSLRTISFMYNNFNGSIPPINKLSSLRNLYLSYNNFSGEIGDNAFDGMSSLRDLYLAHNKFSGQIPNSLVTLKKLQKLNLQGNHFQGRIPDFPQNLSVFDVSGNNLTGRIPLGLSNFDPTNFAGNKDLCGKPLQPCKSSKKKTKLMITVIVAILVVLVAGIAIGSIHTHKKRASNSKLKPKNETRKAQKRTSFKIHGLVTKNEEAQSGSDHELGLCSTSKPRGEVGGLHFVRSDRQEFDLNELLRASAEVLGSGNFGSSYKAVLLNGPAMVVKRFRHMCRVGKEEFFEHMKRLGKLSHPNLLPLVAFYYRKGEKLLVSDFVDNGSLASHLYMKRAPGEAGLSWPTRLNIVKGVARGLSYLHEMFPDLTLPHGHLKSSNVLLDRHFQAILTDYALVPVVNKDHAQEVMVAFKSPEFSKIDRTTEKTDVWSLGILILEILTGKFPANYLRKGKGVDADLASWVNSVVTEEWTGEVFDKEMEGTKNGEGEMLKLLKIGMCCCEWNVDRRWGLRQAVEKIEELKERDNSDNEGFSSYASEGDVYSSIAMSDEDFNLSVAN